MPLRVSGCAAPRHVSPGKPQSDAWAGELERMPEVVVCRGKWLGGVVPLPHLGACRSSGLAGARGAPRRASLGVPWLGRPGELLPPGPWCFGLVVPARSSCPGLVGLAPEDPLAGPRLLAPGRLLLPGLGLLGSITWPSSGPERAVETLVAPLASLAAVCYYCLCTSSGY